jgi:hypothetical protein
MAYRCHNASTSSKQVDEDEEEKGQKKETKTFRGKCQYRCAANLMILQYAVKMAPQRIAELRWHLRCILVEGGRPVSRGCASTLRVLKHQTQS